MIFISYRRDDSKDSAWALASVLSSRLGAESVFIDREGLSPGAVWARGIQQALESTSVLLAVIGPRWHVVADEWGRRRIDNPDDTLVRELTTAFANNVPVIPLYVNGAQPLPAGALPERLAWLAGLQAVQFDLARDQGVLWHLLEKHGVTRDDPLASLIETFVSSGVAQPPRKFVGREWILTRVRDWLNRPQASRLFWITGPPGVGKTAIALHLKGRFDEVAALYLCGDSGKGDPGACVRSIALQLSQHSELHEYRQRLLRLPFKALLEEAKSEVLFDRLLVQPLWKNFPEPRHPLVVLIDGLDETTLDDRNELAEFVASQFAKTPPWLRLIVTSRPDPEVTSPLMAFDPVELKTDSADNMTDLRSYIAEEFAHLHANVDIREAAVETIIERSEGSFLYVYCLFEEVRAGRLTLERPGDFPSGLAGIYRRFFSRKFRNIANYKADIRPALQAIAAAQEPLPIGLLGRCLGWGDQQRGDFEAAVGSLFPVHHARVQPFHRSVLKWLTDPAAAPYYVSALDGHERLAKFGWGGFQSGNLTPYFKRHLPEHLAKAQRNADLEEWLRSSFGIDAIHGPRAYECLYFWRILDGGKAAPRHFVSTLDAREAEGTALNELADLGMKMSWFLGELGLFQEARHIAERGLAWRRQLGEAGASEIAASLYRLGELCRHEKDFATAKQLYDESLAIRKRISGIEAGVCETLHGLAELCQDQRDLPAAKAVYEECLALADKVLTANDAVLGTYLNDYGTVCYESEDRETALRLYDRAERIFRATYGPNHPEYASVEFNKGLIYAEDTHSLLRAWPLLLHALEVHERIYRLDDDRVGKCWRAVADVLNRLPEREKASAWEELIEVHERSLGFDHEVTLNASEQAAWQFIKIDPIWAIARAERAVKRRSELKGPDHPSTATALNTLVRCLQVAGQVSQDPGRFEEAVPHAKRALQIRKSAAGVRPEEVATSCNNLGLLFVELKQADQGIPYLREAILQNPSSPNAYYWLGRAFEGGDRDSEIQCWKDFLSRERHDEERLAHARNRLGALGVSVQADGEVAPH